MSFPNTRLSLIQRLVRESDDGDWAQFVENYWGPLCRFAVFWAGLSWDDAEDIASETMLAVVDDKLLERWHAQPSAKLRSLLCQVARNIMSNEARKRSARQRRLGELADQGLEPSGEPLRSYGESFDLPEDVFYAAWVESLLDASLRHLLVRLNREGKGDYFRVLYGRVCEELPMRRIGESLAISVDTAENYLRAARKCLADELRRAVREQVTTSMKSNRPSMGDPSENSDAEFEHEWQELGDYLQRTGGIDAALRRVQRS